jgi:hypothetical protein
MRKLLFPFFVFFFAISCTNKKKIPKDILQQQKMQAVLWDMISAGEFLSTFVLNKDSLVNKDSTSLKIYGQVFQVHRITKEQFEKSYSYYRDHPELIKEIVDSLNKKQGISNQPWYGDTTRRKTPIPVKIQ